MNCSQCGVGPAQGVQTHRILRLKPLPAHAATTMEALQDSAAETEDAVVCDVCVAHQAHHWQNLDLARALIQYISGGASPSHRTEQRLASIIREHRARWDYGGAR